MNGDANVGRTTKIFLGFFVITILTLGFAWFCYNLFDSKDPSIVSNLEVSLTESKKSINNDDDIIVPHTFNVTNRGSVDASYKVMIYDGSNGMNEFSLDLVHYQLILNNKIIKQGSFSDISNNILDSRMINGNTTNEYNLKVWLDDDIVDDDIKFTYSLKIMPVVEE